MLVENGRVWTRSAAALRVARGLTFPWPLAYVFIVVPRPLRDWVYNRVARQSLSVVRKAGGLHGADTGAARAVHRLSAGAAKPAVDTPSARHYDNGLP